MSDWDAARYDHLSEPQTAWGRRVLERLGPASSERILDLGCGTGRLTREISAEVRDGLVLGFDRSEAMLDVAGRAAPAQSWSRQAGRVYFVRGDAAQLPFCAAFDGVFSTATLHWIADHNAVFRNIYGALRPGGRFVAQCGGGPNLERLYTRATALMRSVPYVTFFAAWKHPWFFAQPDSTRDALGGAGFVDIDTSLEAAPVSFRDETSFAEFIACVCVRHHLERLPSHLQCRFLSDLTEAAAADDPRLTLDYWRLNLSARRPAA